MLDQACPSFSPQVITYFQDIYDRNWYTEGKYTRLCLDLFTKKTSISGVLPVPNGTLGIFLALLALDLPKGSDVLVPSFTFYGSVTPIIFAGLNPVLLIVALTHINHNYITMNNPSLIIPVPLLPFQLMGNP